MAITVDADDLRDLQIDYLRTTKETVPSLRRHAHSLASRKQFKSSFPVLLYLAHQLKGSGGSLGFPRVTEIAAEMSLHLNEFLDDAVPRPTPEELSKSMVILASELESELTARIAALGSEAVS
jgi:HPt (histidine-containing phosphotransfer) domain-containing protein